jgi:hypothetical protein
VERLGVAILGIGVDADALYQRERASPNFTPVRRRVSTVRSAPGPTAGVRGYLHLVLKVRKQDGGLMYGLDFERAEAPGRFETWLDSVGDWGYGIHVPGLRARGTWVQLIGPPFDGDAWIDGETPALSASVEPVQDQLLALRGVRATRAGREQRQTGTFLIQRVSGGSVTFRQEVPSDMPCADDVKPPGALPPSWQAPAREFFDAQGRPLFDVAYPKGC